MAPSRAPPPAPATTRAIPPVNWACSICWGRVRPERCPARRQPGVKTGGPARQQKHGPRHLASAGAALCALAGPERCGRHHLSPTALTRWKKPPCFLQQVLGISKPVVLTCAMRPATVLSPDGPQNSLDAMVVVCDPMAHGVLVVCAGRIHSARNVQKIHPYRLDAFSSGDAGPRGWVEQDHVR